MFSLDDMFLFAYKLKTCVFTVPLVYMNIVRKKDRKGRQQVKTEKFFTHPIGVFIACNSSDFFMGERIPFY